MLTQRLGSGTQKDEAFIQSLIEEIERHPGCCDEVWFATDYGFPPMSVHEESAGRLTGLAGRFRQAGVRVSLQLSNSIGHGQYMSAHDCSALVYDGSPVEKMVGPDGTQAEYCFCWHGEHFRKYVLEEIRLYARMKPYCVWVDDDLRASNHAPVQYGCFCPDCIRRFNQRYGARFDREGLVRAINRGERVWRERYVQFLRDGLADLTEALSRAIHEVSPDTRMGYQYCAHGGYTGYGYDYIFDAMRRGSGHEPLSRPGGGAYNDHDPNIFLHKASFIAWQNAMLPEYVKDIRPEIENLPDVVYGKSIAGTCFETELYLAWGANAMSYAMLMNDYEPMRWHGEMLEEFARRRPYWKALAQVSASTRPAGVRLFLSKEMWKRELAEQEPDFAWSREPYDCAFAQLRCGLPLKWSEGTDDVILLHPEAAKGLSEADIRYLLTRPVMTDGETLHMLVERGHAADFSAAAEPMATGQLYERYLPHPINAEREGRTWSQSFFLTKGHRIVPLDERTEAFSCFESDSRNLRPSDPEGKYPFGVACAVVHTSAGAKWAVFGQAPWPNCISHEKRTQLLSALDYISGNRLPAVLETPQPAVVLPREDEAGRVRAVSVVNCTIGKTQPLLLRVRRAAGRRWKFVCAGSHAFDLPATVQGEDLLVTMPPLMPWSVGTVICTE